MTFLEKLKKQIVSQPFKSVCCRRAMLNGIAFAKGQAMNGLVNISLEGDETITYSSELIVEFFGKTPEVLVNERGGRGKSLSFRSPSLEKYLKSIREGTQELYTGKCASCESAFLRGVFLAAGRMTDPIKKYRLEIAPRLNHGILRDYLSKLGVGLSMTTRREETLLYTANSSTIEDFFAILGLNATAFAVMNSKITREFKNNANRLRNCETNNIQKSVAAAGRALNAIKALEEANLLSTLPEELEHTAMMRLQYPDYSLTRLAAMFTPPISKPGLSHRLNKIIEFSEVALGKREE